MEQQAKKIYTPKEYLELEAASETKHEYFGGEIFAMSGGGYNHALIGTNLLIALGNRLKGKPCRPLGSDARIYTPSGFYTYPDAVVIFGKPEFVPAETHAPTQTITNPALIAEVLSESTRNYDKGGKFDLYRAIPSFTDYLLIEQDRIQLSHFRKTANGEWILHDYKPDDKNVVIDSLQLELDIAELYDGVEF
ncbi:MAG: Uma2 family endonuclease [Rhizobacter sp.]|nr:Uma2 family endonuclease [Chlorobiales bacterium]